VLQPESKTPPKVMGQWYLQHQLLPPHMILTLHHFVWEFASADVFLGGLAASRRKFRNWPLSVYLFMGDYWIFSPLF
jgi:hypothetical protein